MGVPEWLRTALAVLLGCLIAICLAVRHEPTKLVLGGLAVVVAIALIVVELTPDDKS